MSHTSAGFFLRKGTSGSKHSVRNSIVALVGGAVLLAPLLASVPANAAPSVQALPSVASASTSAVKIPLTIALKSVNQSALQSLAANASGLSKSQRVAAVDALAPTDATVDNTVKQFQDAGITVTGHDDWSVSIEATKEQAEQLFNVDLTGTGTKVSTDDTPTIPSALKNSVSGVLGLDSTPLLSPAVYGYQAADLNKAGDVTGASSGGAGMTVATVQFSGWNSNDLAQYAAKTSNTVPSVTSVSVDNQTTVDTTNSTGAMEVALDQQQILDTAPKAKQRIYFAPNSGQGFYDAFNTIANDVPSTGITAVSMSWGFCETSVDAYTMSVLTSAIDRVVALGATTFAASGDYGSSSCGPNTAADVNFPASAPSVIGVGGTTMNKSGTTYTQTAWSGSGGGQSSVTARPSYQSALTLSGSNRLVPDISSVGDPNTGVYGYFGAGGGDLLLGGTSASTPIEAGQYVSTLSSLGCTTGLGDIHAALYNHPSDFVDVTSGSNGAYSATKGYDETTGLGVPQWGKLAFDLPLTGTCVAPVAPPVAITVSAPVVTSVCPANPTSTSVYTNQVTLPVNANATWTTTPYTGGTEYTAIANAGYTITGQSDWQISQVTQPQKLCITPPVVAPPVTTPTPPATTPTTPTAPAATTKVQMKSNTSIYSPSKQYRLAMQADGNLVVYGNGNSTHALWNSKTSGRTGAYLVTNSTGNLQIVSKDGKTVYWTSGTGAHGTLNNTIAITNNGDFQLLKGTTLIWHDNSVGSNALYKGASLTSGQYIYAGAVKLTFQSDGNMVIYKGSRAVWSTHTSVKAKGGRFAYQTDGNLVVYSSTGKVVWAANTSKKASEHLSIQSNGNFVLYNGSKVMWDVILSNK